MIVTFRRHIGGAAIGCATFILCFFAILLCFLIAAAAVLIGAFVGGQLGKAAAESGRPLEPHMPDILTPIRTNT
jgi:hypothetical protein